MFHLEVLLNMFMAKLQRLGRIRQLHTIISQETIKPSSPTPPHLKIHNLSIIDYSTTHIHMPMLFFYNTTHNINTLKKSLSQCLTQYYPFAGRFPSPFAHHIECSDQGVVFLEASIDDRLDNFKNEQDKTLEQLIPNGLGCAVEKTSPNMMEVQLNHFTCGGVALGVSISHKIADGFTMLNLCNHWAAVARGASVTNLNPRFVNSPISHFKFPEYQIKESRNVVNYSKRKFVFTNAKINELRKKINAMGAGAGATPLNPTRIESLTSLLFTCALRASKSATKSANKTRSRSLQPSNLCQVVNLRNNKFGTNYPDLMAGNLSVSVIATMADSGEFELDRVITDLRKEMMNLEGVRDVEEAAKVLENSVDAYSNGGPVYIFTSTCWFPFYKVDFGWGKPAKVMLLHGFPGNNFILMDSPCGDGIEAVVQLEEDEMMVLEKDEEVLAYAQCI